MSDVKRIDCRNQDCPIPLIETRKAVMNGQKGDIIEIIGTHESSKKEIPMALESMHCTVLDIKEENNNNHPISPRYT